MNRSWKAEFHEMPGVAGRMVPACLNAAQAGAAAAKFPLLAARPFSQSNPTNNQKQDMGKLTLV